MASFTTRMGWKRSRKKENKSCRSVSFRFVPTQRVIENSKNKAKKFKNTIMAPFRAKIGCKKMRKRENKNYHFVPFLSDA